MRWEDERYVRLYTRDTVDWLGLSFIAQGLFCLILRKVDRAGLLKLGKPGKRGVAIVIGFPGDWTRLEPALEELILDGCVQIRGEYLVVPNFIEAQEAVQSDAQRKRESRARDRDRKAARAILNPDKTSESVTGSHDSGQKVTPSHAESRAVTNGHPLPSLAVPSVDPPPTRARARLVSPFPPGKDPAPNTTAVLAALHARGIPDAAPPSQRSEATVEAVIASVGVEAAAERLAAVLADPEAKRPLTYHLGAIRGEKRPPKHGDLGCDNDPWHWHLTPEQVRAYREERRAVAPDLDDAPIGIVGPERELAALNDKYRQIVEART